MVGCYLNSLPREFMRVMAGHPRYMGCFEVPRAGVAPPDELLSMIWPELDSWKGRFGPQGGQVHDLAAMGMTDLLFYLREVILQDSVVLRKRFPGNPVWNHAMFQHPAYSEFAERMEGAVELVDNEERPTKLTLLAQAMPELAEGLHCLRGDLRELQSTVAEQVQVQSVRHAHIQHLLTSGSFTLRFDPSSCPPPPSYGPVPAPVAAAAASSSSGGNGGNDTLAPVSLAASLAANPATNPTASSPGSAGETPAEPPRYSMCRSVQSVERLWLFVAHGNRYGS